jgi:hypothetical protein
MLSLCDVVAVVESSRLPFAQRFEPSLYIRVCGSGLSDAETAALNLIRRANFCDGNTARAIFSTSYGLYQFLGETLYSSPINFALPIGQFLTSEALQRSTFYKFVDAHRVNYSINDLLGPGTYATDFARVFNGPGNVDDYAAKLIAAARLLNGAPAPLQPVTA